MPRWARGLWRRRRRGNLELRCTLPSRMPGYCFTAHLTGEWEELPARIPHEHPNAVAIDYALSRAQEITNNRQLSQATAAEAAINSCLGQPRELAQASVRLLWARIQLNAHHQEAVHVERLLREQHQAELHAHQCRNRLQRATDLREALLSDPSLAFAYWFLDHPEAIDTETVQRIESLIAAAASYAPHNGWVQAAQILQEFVRDLSDEAREHLVTGLAHIFDRFGQPERARQLRTVGGTPLPPPASPGLNGHA
jgi:hypothetical protein